MFSIGLKRTAKPVLEFQDGNENLSITSRPLRMMQPSWLLTPNFPVVDPTVNQKVYTSKRACLEENWHLMVISQVSYSGFQEKKIKVSEVTLKDNPQCAKQVFVERWCLLQHYLS